MCLAIPSRVTGITGSMATVERFGECLEISLALMSEPVRIGDYVVVQARSYAVGRVDPDEAREAQRLFQELAEVLQDTDFDRTLTDEQVA